MAEVGLRAGCWVPHPGSDVGRALPAALCSAGATRPTCLLPDVFVPQLGVSADELAHQVDALGIVEDFELDAA